MTGTGEFVSLRLRLSRRNTPHIIPRLELYQHRNFVAAVWVHLSSDCRESEIAGLLPVCAEPDSRTRICRNLRFRKDPCLQVEGVPAGWMYRSQSQAWDIRMAGFGLRLVI